jgi:putative endonuclease
MYEVYILYSESTGKYYKGQTDNLEGRLRRHNHGYEKATKRGIPWKLIWHVKVEDRVQAVALEKKIKHLTISRVKRFMEKYGVGVAGPDDPD